MEAFIGFIGFMFLAMVVSIIFIVVYIYKGIQFTLTATNLYKKILNREDVIIKLLLDIRDNTKAVQPEEIKIINEKVESSSGDTNAKVASVEEGPACPVCKGKNTYYDIKKNLFCRDCRKITDLKNINDKSIEELKAQKNKLLQEKKDLEDKQAHSKALNM